MRVVLDTNVLVSAALRDRDPEAVLLFLMGTAGVEWVASSEIVDEYKSVLSRAKFGLPPDVLAGWLTLVDRHVAVIDVSGDLPPVRDAKDAMFLACAMAVCADFIVTGDRDLAPEGTPRRIGGTTVVSVADFKGLVCDRWKRE